MILPIKFMLHNFFSTLHVNCIIFSQIYCLVLFFIAMDMKQSRKKRKQGKSLKRDHQHDKQVATATTTSSKASKSGQKKAKLKKSGNYRTGA